MNESNEEKIERLKIEQLDEVIDELRQEIYECDKIVFQYRTLLAQNKRHGFSFMPNNDYKN